LRSASVLRVLVVVAEDSVAVAAVRAVEASVAVQTVAAGVRNAVREDHLGRGIDKPVRITT
jgi:hypothetical protein